MSLGHDGVDAARPLRGKREAATERSREWQADQIRRTGFATPQAEVGHAIVLAMRRRGYSVTVAHVAGHLGAVATAYNWQGNTRIAELIGRHKRTVQRARARLEADGFIRSELLLTGDMIDGQRAPVWHPQVVRDVSRLQRLARAREAVREPRKRRRRPSAAEVPKPADEQEMSVEQMRALADAHPEFAWFWNERAEAARGRTPPNAPKAVPPEVIDDADRAIAEAERELREKEARERGPPERGPPER